MDILMIWVMILGAIGVGYFLGLWHDAPDRRLREVMLEQRLERLARERLYVPRERR